MPPENEYDELGGESNWWAGYNGFQEKRTNLPLGIFVTGLGFGSSIFFVKSLNTYSLTVKHFALQMSIRVLLVFSFVPMGISLLSAYLSRQQIPLFIGGKVSSSLLMDIGIVLNKIALCLILLVSSWVIGEHSATGIFFCCSPGNLPLVMMVTMTLFQPFCALLIFKCHTWYSIAISSLLSILTFIAMECIFGGSRYHSEVIAATFFTFALWDIESCHQEAYEYARKMDNIMVMSKGSLDGHFKPQIDSHHSIMSYQCQELLQGDFSQTLPNYSSFRPYYRGIGREYYDTRVNDETLQQQCQELKAKYFPGGKS